MIYEECFAQGCKNGQLTFSELLAATEDFPLNGEQIAELYEQLMAANMVLTDDLTKAAVSDALAFLDQYEGEDPAKTYLLALDATPFLTENERALLEKQAQEDAAAKEQLLIFYLRLAVGISMRYIGFGVTLLDLLQMASVGMIVARDEHDFSGCVPFSFRALFRVRRAIMRGLDERPYHHGIPC